jgi:hypothetical protein
MYLRHALELQSGRELEVGLCTFVYCNNLVSAQILLKDIVLKCLTGMCSTSVILLCAYTEQFL